MCYNATSSLITFSIGFSCFLYLMYTGITSKNNYDIFAGVITLLVASMQFVEYVIWRNQECSFTNHYASLSIVVVLFLQAIASTLMGLTFFKPVSNTLNSVMTFLILPYTLFVGYLLTWLNRFILCTKPTEKSCRLYWAPFKALNENDSTHSLTYIFHFFYFLMGLFGFGFLNRFFGKENIGAKRYPWRYSILSIAFVAAVILSIYTNGEYSLDIFGSYWCFIAVVYGIVSCLHI